MCVCVCVRVRMCVRVCERLLPRPQLLCVSPPQPYPPRFNRVLYSSLQHVCFRHTLEAEPEFLFFHGPNTILDNLPEQRFVRPSQSQRENARACAACVPGRRGKGCVCWSFVSARSSPVGAGSSGSTPALHPYHPSLTTTGNSSTLSTFLVNIRPLLHNHLG